MNYFAPVILLALTPVLLTADTPLQLRLRELNAAITVQSPTLRLLRERHQVIATILAEEPASLTGLTLDPSAAERLLAAFPEASSLIESAGAWVGVLGEIVADDFGRQRATVQQFLTLSTGEPLHLLNHVELPSPKAGCGLTVRIQGVRLGSSLYSIGAIRLTQPSDASPCSPIGQQKIATILVSYPSYPLNAGWTISSATSLFYGTTNSLAAYLNEVSYGRTSVTGQVYGPYALDTDFPCMPNMDLFWASIVRAIGAKIDFRAYNRVLVITPFVKDCVGQNAGESLTACQPMPLANGGAAPLTISEAAVSSTHLIQEILPTALHEIGHALGLSGHAGTLGFAGAPLGRLDQAGVAVEYGDWYSTMGGPFCNAGLCTSGHFNAFHKTQLGWLDMTTDVATVSASGKYSIQPIESSTGTNPRALRIQRPGTNRYLWIEYRQPIGFDASLAVWSSAAYKGVMIRYQNAPGFESTLYSHLLDFTPSTADDFADSPLLPGGTWSDPDSPLTIRADTLNSSGLDLTISYDTPCVTAAAPSAIPGAGGTFTIAVQAPASCQWTADSQTSWLTLLSGAAGVGPGTVTLSATPNLADPRTGVVVIGRSQAVVTQAVTGSSLYSSLGAAGEWSASTGATIGRTSSPGPSATVAAPFRLSTGATLSAVEIGILNVGDLSKGRLTMVLFNDVDGRPGTALETIPVDSALVIGRQSLVLIPSSSHTRLQAGQQYWIALVPTYTQPSDKQLCAWGSNTVGIQAPVQFQTDRDPQWRTAQPAQLALRIRGVAVPGPVLSSLKNGASYQAGTVAPGELVALFGSGIGPADLTSGALQSGRLTTSVGQTQVLFDGIPAPVVYARSDTVAVFAPFSLSDLTTTHLQVRYAGEAGNVLTLPVAPAIPGIFSTDASGNGQGAILNQDSGQNSATNPAASGEIIVSYATGAGQTNPAGSDGRVAETIFPAPILSPLLTIGGRPAEIFYFGQAPGQVEGVVQVNARIPSQLLSGSHPVILSVGGIANQQNLMIAVQ